MGGAEDGYQYVVECMALDIENLAVVDGIRLGLGERFARGGPEYLGSDGYGVAAAEADDGYGTAGRGGEGADGVFKYAMIIHLFTFVPDMCDTGVSLIIFKS